MAFSFSILSGLGNLQARAEQKDPQLYFKLGWSYYDRGQFSKAISAFDKAIELRPGNMEYLLSRGDTFDRIERYDRAFLDYRRVLKVKPVTAEQFYWRAQALEHLSRYDETLEFLDQAINKGYTGYRVHRLKGKALYRLDRFDEAISELRKSIAIKKQPTTYLHLARSYRANGSVDRALVTLKEAIGLFGDDSNLALEQTITLLVAEEPEQAQAAFRAFQKSDPYRLFEFSSWRDLVLHAEAEKKLDNYSKIIALSKMSNTALYYERAVLYMELARYDRAGEEMNRFLKLTDWSGKAGVSGATIAYLCFRLCGKRYEADAIVRQSGRKLKLEEWPGPLFRFVIGSITETELESLASDKKRKTQSGYYRGMIDLLHRRNDLARHKLKSVLEHGDRGLDEYALSRAELRRLEHRKSIGKKS